MNHQIKTIYLIGTEDYWGNAKHNIFYTGLYADSEAEAKKYIEEKCNNIGIIKPVLSIHVDNKVLILKDGKEMCNINDVQRKNDIQLISCEVGMAVHSQNIEEHEVKNGKTVIINTTEPIISKEVDELLFEK